MFGLSDQIFGNRCACVRGCAGYMRELMGVEMCLCVDVRVCVCLFQDFVQAYWRGGRRMYPGTLTDLNTDGTFSISYSDGDFEPSVKPENIK
jgi:hypothetical protein